MPSYAFQLALPYLEPYFIDAIREGAELVADPKLKAEVLAGESLAPTQALLGCCNLLVPRGVARSKSNPRRILAGGAGDEAMGAVILTGREAIPMRVIRTLVERLASNQSVSTDMAVEARS
jgi:hypothetical protein